MIKFFKKISLILVCWTCIYLFLKHIMTIPRHYGVAGFIQMIFEAIVTVACVVSALWILLTISFFKKGITGRIFKLRIYLCC